MTSVVPKRTKKSRAFSPCCCFLSRVCGLKIAELVPPAFASFADNSGQVLTAGVLDFHAGDAAAFHLQHSISAAMVFESLAAFGNFAELRQHKSRQGLKPFIAGQTDVILHLQIANVR